MATKLNEYIRQVYPEIDLSGWNPLCPITSEPIEIDSKSYLVFAQRHWCYGSCKASNQEYLLDIPTLLYNFWHPQIMDISTGEVYGRDTWWKADMYDLYFNYYKPKLNDKPKEKLADIVLTNLKNLTPLLKRGAYKELYLKTQRKLLSLNKRGKSFLNKPKPSLKVVSKSGCKTDSILLFNCLDDYYGHTTRFIQFVYNTYDEIGEELKQQGISTAIVIPEYLQFYVPNFIDEVWIATHVPYLFGKGTFRTVEFNDELNAEIHKREKVFLLKKQPDISSGVDARRYFHMDVVQQETKLCLENKYPIIVFYHREDYRCWGGHPKQELINYSKLANLVKQTYSSAGIYVVGLKNNYPINNSNIVDLRTNGIPDNYVQKQIDYLYLLSQTNLAVGIHGSHMTEISALAKSVITLQPKHRFGNYSDDMFLIKSSNFIPDFQRFYSLFGSDLLDEISPEFVFDILKSAISLGYENYLRLKGIYDEVID
jgi:hypothetical protein